LVYTRGGQTTARMAIYGPLGFLIRPAELVHALTYEGVKGKEPAYVLVLCIV